MLSNEQIAKKSYEDHCKDHNENCDPWSDLPYQERKEWIDAIREHRCGCKDCRKTKKNCLEEKE